MFWIKTKNISRTMAGCVWGYEVTIFHAFNFPVILFNNTLAFLERLGQSSFEKNPRTIQTPKTHGTTTFNILTWPDPYYHSKEYEIYKMVVFDFGVIWGKHPFKHFKNMPRWFGPLIVLNGFKKIKTLGYLGSFN